MGFHQEALEDAKTRIEVRRGHFHLDVEASLADRGRVEPVNMVGCPNQNDWVAAQLVDLG